MAPATPTGLHVDEVTPDSITWHWNAVEGALGYAVQVSLDEMFDDMDEIGLTVENHFTATPVPPETNVYLRVRAGAGTPEALAAAVATGDLSGLALSDWSTHVTGRTDMVPVPPPPAPAAVMASFMVPDDADSMYPMIPDEDDDKETAMAMVNPSMTVTSNTTAVVVPMNFAEGANPVKLHEGDNWPFQFVDWQAMQSMVVDEGAQFKIMRVTVGAAQEMEPTGDVAYVTCGPFECVEGMDAPEIGIANSTACEGWDPTLDLVVGVVDANGIDESADDAGDAVAAGLDLGWIYTANTSFTITHDFGAFSEDGGDQGKSSTPQALAAGRKPATGTTARRNVTHGDFVVIDVDQDTRTGTDATATAFQDRDGCKDSFYRSGAVSKPANCFRLMQTEDEDFFNQYSVELAPKDAGVAWGEIGWDAFKDLKCEKTAFMAAEEVDVCELLGNEVDGLGRVSVIPVVSVPASAPTGAAAGVTAGSQAKLTGLDLSISIDKTQWTALQYYDTTTASKTDTDDLYDGVPATTAGAVNVPGRLNGVTDRNNDGIISTTVTDNESHRAWIKIHDSDGDPIHGDLGKVDANETLQSTSVTAEDHLKEADSDYLGPFGGDDRADNYFGNSDAAKCSDDDGGEASTTQNSDAPLTDGDDAGTGTSHAALSVGDGTLCDADVEIETSVTFTDGMGFDCAVERSYTVSCQWDASGGIRGGALAEGLTATNVNRFLKCTVN